MNEKQTLGAKSILFIHRSVGQNLIHDGQLYKVMERAANAAGLAINLTDINNNQQKGIPGEDTKPRDYARYFKEHGLTEDLVIIKSCYPNNAIKSDDALRQLQQAYREIVANFLTKSSGKLLIMTTPPLHATRTTKQEAQRARALATWLTEQHFDSRLQIFDLYNLLAEPEGAPKANMLRRAYQRFWPWDSHPNKKASLTIAPKLASAATDFLS